MKNLARDVFTFLGIFLILFHLYPEYKYWTNQYKEEVNGGEVYQAIEKSKKRGKKKELTFPFFNQHSSFVQSV